MIGLAKARQLKVIERAIMPEELAKAQEVFLTGTAAEVTPVREIGQYNFTPGAITKALIEDFDRSVRAAPKRPARPRTSTHRFAASSSVDWASTQRSPCAVSSSFQNGALVLSQSTRNSQDAKAAARCGAAVTTSTMRSPGSNLP